MKQKWFVFFAMVTGFCIAAEYAITRPASHSLFLSVFSSKGIPLLWLATVPVNLAAIFLYNRFLPKIGPLKIFTLLSCGVIGVNLLAGILLPIFPEYIFIQCVWKDIYILLMFKQLWSMIHTTIASDKAKYLYGLIFAVGTVGSCLGSCIPGFFAVPLRSETLFFFTFPFYLCVLLAYRGAFARCHITKESLKQDFVPKASEGFALILRNRFLAAVLLLVIAMQVSSGFLEYRFNAYLEVSIIDQDLRTAYCGKLFGFMNLLSVLLQAVGSFLIIHVIGLKNTHALIPILLLGSAVCSWMIPSFAFLSFSYVFLKAVDFSLFSVSREMLYIPFNPDEKFRAKAVIDVFAYRSSKALVSLSILFLQAIAGIYLLEIATYVSIGIFIGWIGVVFFMLRPSVFLGAIQPERVYTRSASRAPKRTELKSI